MQLSAYVTAQEVQRVCQELGLSDWSKMKELQFIFYALVFAPQRGADPGGALGQDMVF